MVYVKSNYSTSSWGRLKYIFDDPAHDGSEHRVLSVTGNNIKLWSSNDGVFPNQSGYFLNKQFKSIKKKAWNKRKRHEAQHMILSFSEKEFSTDNPNDLKKESDQINELVKGFMNERFPNTQWVSAIQCDGEGHKLHAHVLINSVKPDGRCIPTKQFSVTPLRNQWNRYLNQNYLLVTGHLYLSPFDNKKPGKTIKSKGWQEELQKTLDWARQKAKSIEKYLDLLKSKDVSVINRNKRGDWSYHVSVNGKDKAVRDFYQRIDKKTGLVKSTRGMGQEYTPKSLKGYFKNKQESDSNEKQQENGRNDQRLEQLARGESRRREKQLVRRFIIRREDEERDKLSNKTGHSEFVSGLDGKD